MIAAEDNTTPIESKTAASTQGEADGELSRKKCDPPCNTSQTVLGHRVFPCLSLHTLQVCRSNSSYIQHRAPRPKSALPLAVHYILLYLLQASRPAASNVGSTGSGLLTATSKNRYLLLVYCRQSVQQWLIYQYLQCERRNTGVPRGIACGQAAAVLVQSSVAGCKRQACQRLLGS